MGFFGETPPGDVIPNSYVVVLKPNLSDQEITSHIESIKSLPAQGIAQISQTSIERFSFQPSGDAAVAFRGEPYPSAFSGYMGTFPPSALQSIKESSVVDYVEPNQYFRIQNAVVQPNPPSWGLSRLSHRGPFKSQNNEYVYDSDEAGQGVTAYVIDTGIRLDHQEFGGRARWGKTIPNGASDTDNQGHGTHVAGTIAGANYGVAKKASVVAVKVFPDNVGYTDTATIIKGMEWAVNDAQTNGVIKKTVMNMSIGGGSSQAMDQAVDRTVQAGMVVVVAASNEGRNANESSPARAPNALTVGAIDQSDAMPEWSSWGQILDINAPGVDIVSCGISGPDAKATMSGTSMASPHIAGLVSCLRQNPNTTEFHSLAYELRLRAEGGCKPYPGNEAGTPNLAAVNKKV